MAKAAANVSVTTPSPAKRRPGTKRMIGQPNWAQKWTKIVPTSTISDSSNDEDAILVKPIPDSDRTVSTSEFDGNEELPQSAGVSFENTVIDLESEVEAPDAGATEEVTKATCPVRGCGCLCASLSKMLTHALISHPKSRYAEELRDLGWSDSLSLHKSNRSDLKFLAGVRIPSMSLSKLFRTNPRSAKIPISVSIAKEIQITVDAGIGDALLSICQGRQNAGRRSENEAENGTLNSLLAQVVADAEELTDLSRKRLARYFTLFRDLIIQETNGKQTGYRWENFQRYIDSGITDHSITTTLSTVQLANRALFSNPASPAALLRSSLAVKFMLGSIIGAKILRSNHTVQDSQKILGNLKEELSCSTTRWTSIKDEWNTIKGRSTADVVVSGKQSSYLNHVMGQSLSGNSARNQCLFQVAVDEMTKSYRRGSHDVASDYSNSSDHCNELFVTNLAAFEGPSSGIVDFSRFLLHLAGEEPTANAPDLIRTIEHGSQQPLSPRARTDRIIP